MSQKKGGVTMEEREREQTEARFTKQQMLVSARYNNRKDLVSALLDEGKTYTIEEVDRMVDRFMKGKVR